MKNKFRVILAENRKTIADGWNSTGRTLDKFIPVREVLADGVVLSFKE